MKTKKPMNKYLKIFLTTWGILILYEILFMNTKFGLNNFISEDSLLYTLMILIPMIAIIAFFGAFIVASHYKEIKDTWENKPEKIIDELKLLGIGLLFFIFIWVIYFIFHN
ncbi:hypothetical protein IKE67_04950 [bacterium]|nr:hypothetical protein [bacterium]